jgi:hypothetical protein
LILAIASPAVGQTWLTGPALRKKLDQEVDLAWSETRLRDALSSLAQAHQVAVLLDRRIDPDREIELQLERMPLRAALDQIAQSVGASAGMLEAVAFFGPPEAVSRIRTVAALRKEELGRLPPARRLELVRVRPWRWEDLATPRELLEQLAAESRLEIRGLGQVPHDLWAGANLPPLAASDRLMLVCGQFDLTFRWAADGTEVTLVPMPEQPTLERTYPGGRRPDEFAAQLAQALPASQVRVADGKIVVTGPLDDHDRIEEGQARGTNVMAKSNPPAASVKPADVRINNFQVENIPLNRVLDHLRERLGLTIEVDAAKLRAAGISLDMLISVHIKNGTLDDLLRATLAPARLTFRRTEKRVEVFPEVQVR